MNDQRAAFRPVAQNYHRLMQRWKVLMVPQAIVCLALLPSSPWATLVAFLAFQGFIIRDALKCGSCDCPACSKNILHAGCFCPVCASPIDHSRGFLGPTCSNCGTLIEITRYDRRRYRIRYCPHCAALLSDEGL